LIFSDLDKYKVIEEKTNEEYYKAKTQSFDEKQYLTKRKRKDIDYDNDFPPAFRRAQTDPSQT